jgi:hypothetical protein
VLTVVQGIYHELGISHFMLYLNARAQDAPSRSSIVGYGWDPFWLSSMQFEDVGAGGSNAGVASMCSKYAEHPAAVITLRAEEFLVLLLSLDEGLFEEVGIWKWSVRARAANKVKTYSRSWQIE